MAGKTKTTAEKIEVGHSFSRASSTRGWSGEHTFVIVAIDGDLVTLIEDIPGVQYPARKKLQLPKSAVIDLIEGNTPPRATPVKARDEAVKDDNFIMPGFDGLVAHGRKSGE